MATSDRDNKIRISHYPNGYHIDGYCPGHTDFVSTVSLLRDHHMVTGGVDGTVWLWDLRDCSLLATEVLTATGCGAAIAGPADQSSISAVRCCGKGMSLAAASTVAVAVAGSVRVIIFEVSTVAASASFVRISELVCDGEVTSIAVAETGSIWVCTTAHPAPLIVYDPDPCIAERFRRRDSIAVAALGFDSVLKAADSMESASDRVELVALLKVPDSDQADPY